jgi:hypothetical protein
MTVIRFLVLVLLTGALLLAPLPLRAAHDDTCHLLATLDGARFYAGRFVFRQGKGAEPPPPFSFQLLVKIAPDGTATARGVLHLADEDAPAVLVATGEAKVVCNELGITGLSVDLLEPSSSPRGGVRIFDISNPSPPIAGNRLYVGNLTLTGGDTTIRLDAVNFLVEVLGKGKHGEQRR